MLPVTFRFSQPGLTESCRCHCGRGVPRVCLREECTNSGLCDTRATEEWCAARRGARTTPCAICSPAGLTGKPLAGASTSPHCYRRSEVAALPSGAAAVDLWTGAALLLSAKPFFCESGPAKGDLYVLFSLYPACMKCTAKRMVICLISVLCVWGRPLPRADKAPFPWPGVCRELLRLTADGMALTFV